MRTAGSHGYTEGIGVVTLKGVTPTRTGCRFLPLKRHSKPVKTTLKPKRLKRRRSTRTPSTGKVVTAFQRTRSRYLTLQSRENASASSERASLSRITGSRSHLTTSLSLVTPIASRLIATASRVTTIPSHVTTIASRLTTIFSPRIPCSWTQMPDQWARSSHRDPLQDYEMAGFSA